MHCGECVDVVRECVGDNLEARNAIWGRIVLICPCIGALQDCVGVIWERVGLVRERIGAIWECIGVVRGSHGGLPAIDWDGVRDHAGGA